jgi:phage shock protein PspC (stress-responsive transcriptional regulator)
MSFLSGVIFSDFKSLKMLAHPCAKLIKAQDDSSEARHRLIQLEQTMAERTGIRRSGRNKLIGGVCAGIAEHFGWSVTATRVVYVLASVLSAAFPGLLVYVVLWLVLPMGSE